MMRRVVIGLAAVVAAFFVVRGVVELFTIGWGDPASYRDDWGGPSLIGVLLVHTGPAVIALALAGRWLVQRRRGN